VLGFSQTINNPGRTNKKHQGALLLFSSLPLLFINFSCCVPQLAHDEVAAMRKEAIKMNAAL
jgi:hypothetical protein